MSCSAGGATSVPVVCSTDRFRLDDEAESDTKRELQGTGPNRSDFLALDPAPGVPILEHARLSEVVAQLRAFLEKVRISGFDIEL